MSAVIGLDIGDQRIGVAASDAQRLIATPLEVIPNTGWGPVVRRVCALCAERGATEVVSGLPLNMDGSRGFQAEKVQNLCAQLEKAGLTVYYQDERLTTVAAEGALLSGGVHGRDRRQLVDKVAAAVILQTWLDRQQAESAPRSSRDEEEEQAMSEEMDNIVELVDEDGNTVQLELIGGFEYKGSHYIVVTDPEDDGDDEEVAVDILEVTQDENGEEIYATIEDEAFEEEVFQYFLSLDDEEDEEGSDAE